MPDREASASRWSIDHLFVDQDAVPTLVEGKRSTDTRIRREVVGQLLDYAANGVRYWPLADPRASFEATQHRLGREPLDVMSELCADNLTTIDEFFERLGDNLRAGRIRMIFVADIIPDELKRITELLNEQMSPAEVLAVEVKQYMGRLWHKRPGAARRRRRPFGEASSAQHRSTAARTSSCVTASPARSLAATCSAAGYTPCISPGHTTHSGTPRPGWRLPVARPRRGLLGGSPNRGPGQQGRAPASLDDWRRPGGQL